MAAEVKLKTIFCNFSSNLSNEGSPFLLSSDQAEEIFTKATEGGDSEPLSESINKWHFIHLQ